MRVGKGCGYVVVGTTVWWKGGGVGLLHIARLTCVLVLALESQP